MKRHVKREILADIMGLPASYKDLDYELNHKYGNTTVLGHFTDNEPIPIRIEEFLQDTNNDFYISFNIPSLNNDLIKEISLKITDKKLKYFDPIHIEYGNVYDIPGVATGLIRRTFDKSYKKSTTIKYLVEYHPYHNIRAPVDDTVATLSSIHVNPNPVDMFNINHKGIPKHKLNSYEGLIGRFRIPFNYTYIGIELEFEGVNDSKDVFECLESSYRGAFTPILDYSLKVGGMEFVSPPIRAKYVEMELRRLFDKFNPKVSSRCSMHVHLNVRDLKYYEIMKLMMIYCLYERKIYRISGDRWFNNFCVPLRHNPTAVIHVLNGNTPNESWGKYSGLNLLPILSGGDCKGTVEFRMHEGTTDVERIIRFISIITTLKQLARWKHPLEDHSLRLFGLYVKQDEMWKKVFSKMNEIQPWLKGGS